MIGCKITRFVTGCVILTSLNITSVYASIWDGDTGVIAQLAEHIKVAKDTLKEAADTKNAIEALRDLEHKDNPLNHIYKTGRNLSDIANDLNATVSHAHRFLADPYGLQTIANDIDSVEEQLKDAQEANNIARIGELGKLLADLKRIEWLRERNKDAQEDEDSTNSENQAKSTNALLSIESNLTKIIEERALAKKESIEESRYFERDLVKGYDALK